MFRTLLLRDRSSIGYMGMGVIGGNIEVRMSEWSAGGVAELRFLFLAGYRGGRGS